MSVLWVNTNLCTVYVSNCVTDAFLILYKKNHSWQDEIYNCRMSRIGLSDKKGSAEGDGSQGQ